MGSELVERSKKYNKRALEDNTIPSNARIARWYVYYNFKFGVIVKD